MLVLFAGAYVAPVVWVFFATRCGVGVSYSGVVWRPIVSP